MDTETRHELERNSLAELMVKSTHAARNTWMYWVGGLVAVAVVGVSLLVWNVSRAERLQQAWKALENAQGQPDALEQITVDFAGTPVVAPAHMNIGWVRFVEGKRQIIDNRGEGIRLFDEAIEEFEKAMDADSAEDIKAQALFGIAMAREYQCKVEQAREGYEAIATQFAGYQIADVSKRRLERLGTPETVKFYTAMKNYSPPAPTTDLPPKIDSGLPEPGIVPGIPSIDAPSPPSDLLPDSTLLPSTSEPSDPAATPVIENKELPAPPSNEPSAPPAPSDPPPASPSEPAPPPTAPAEPTPPEPAPAEPAPTTPAPEQPKPEPPSTPNPPSS